MKLKFAVASLLAAVSMSSFAADQSVTVDLTDAVTFKGVGTLFDGGSDTITFTGLNAGVYNIIIDLTGQNISFNAGATTLNGVAGLAVDASQGKYKFLGVEATNESPFILELAGAVTGAKAAYTGVVNVSAVPEPTTYGMLLGGLGIMGFLARRKAKKA
ncbi:putative secreted protein with PEP-CTERM sorting signal [Pseudoduganella lurida]|uniref:Putative secreted protein with PEP-CTERM sorting signal n=1 Tax=Pseudoduganella lurida TaxID=1036180 RepID=A0A562R8A5_9BURK|nr:FxDxF family PEP-CTERM protein [Pseudoduganella lurida]TWI65113.1 putative secreted protein with PEP-CTERM sorting signal [Pseudoduganella lurida]